MIVAIGGEGIVVKLFVGETVLVDTVVSDRVDAGDGDCLGTFEPPRGVNFAAAADLAKPS